MSEDYIEFGIVYRIDDLDDGSFYIGQTTLKKKWDNGYLGSGKPKRHKHKNMYPPKHLYPDHPNAHEYKRTILYKDIKSKNKLNELELKEILKYSTQDEYGIWKVSDPNCMNIKTVLQNNYDHSKAGLCQECGVRYSHKSWCSKSPGVYKECGYSLQSHRHAKTCSKYKSMKTRKICPECGSKSAHKRFCSKYKEPKKSICSECGGGHGKHKKYCSKYLGICQECGYSLQSNQHAKSCSQYKEPKLCHECGGKNNNHKRNCSKYTPNPLCKECGAPNNAHLKTCSQFKQIVCEECGDKGGIHKRGCSKFKESKIICEECGCKRGAHLKTCSKFKKKPCFICGSLTAHKKDCPNKPKNKNI